ncbi:MotA/TolQ/ExbB proton channel family protein [Leeia sp. TBRC 13508]|uniref:MotA/TolQ/ExbB proton channel family protein n=1 Tax=Leeia speluncae TaxID=2884804 RepID=A0ABS8D7I3_9NEIS|nr:MotA/TolQ/ExbB proton channel family protein [Leeia speluncae]MCB6184147.1 MotA/TolQ/ExbB proton channel family protein [Leeia speluncae]
MLSIIEAAGWPIWLLIVASILAVGIIFERFWSLRTTLVAPHGLLKDVVQDYRQNGVNEALLKKLLDPNAPLMARVYASGLKNVGSTREVMKESIEEAGRAASIELERFLTLLGTIAALSPLLGLFGTVIGMIEIFGAQNPATGNNPAVLAHGISVALYNTAFGILVAVPSMGFYRHFRARVDQLLVEMEQQAIKLVEIVHGERRN